MVEAMRPPCRGGEDGHDHCSRLQPCRYGRELAAGLREERWVVERCEELRSREEGWSEVEELKGRGDGR